MRPEHDFSHMDREKWEATVFENADHFSCFRHLGRGQRYHVDYKSFADALADARSDARSLLYAITESGRSTCIDRKDWDRCEQLWNLRKLPKVRGKRR